MRLKTLIRIYLHILIFSAFFSWNQSGLYAQNQESILTKYSVNDGLPQSTVNCIKQDSKGFIWIGTCGGLCRFDGYEFITFKSHPDYKNTLTNNFVRSIHEDSLGNLWIGVETGIDLINPKNLNISHPFTKDIVFKNIAFVFYSTKEYVMFADNNSALYRYWPKTKVLKKVFENSILKSLNEKTLIKDKFVWFYNCTEKTLIRYSLQDNSIIQKRIPDLYTDKFLYSIVDFDQNSILLCFDKQNIILETSNLTIFDKNKFHFLSDIERYFINDQNNKSWILSKNKSIKSFTREGIEKAEYFTEEKPWKTMPVTCIFSDKENNLWIGTDGSDIFKFSPDRLKFNAFHFKENKGTNSNFIRCFYKKQDGDLLVSTFDGLFKISNDFSKTEKIDFDKKNKPNILRFNEFTNDLILMGTDKGLYIFDYKTKKVVSRISHAVNEKIPISEIKAFFISSKNRILVGCYEGIYELRQNNKLGYYLFKLANLSSTNLFELNSDRFINSQSRNGFCILKILQDTVLIDQSYKLPKQYYYSAFRYFFRDKKNQLWAAASIGLVKFDENLKIVKIYTEKDGLPDNNVYGVLEDKNGKFWMSSNKGLSVFNGKEFRNFGVDDGLQSNEFNSTAFFAFQDTYYFGGINGFNYFNPYKVSDKITHQKIEITKLEITGEKGKNFYPQLKDKNLVLKYYENFLSIEITSLQYSNIKEIEFAYFLESYDNEWIFQGNRRNIRFNNLPPGNYTLYIKSTNSDHLWSKAQKLLTIKIKPPFYKTLLFKIFIGILIALIVTISLFLYIRYKTNKQKRIIEQLKRIEEVRIRISRDLHDNAGSELTRISMISELAKLDCKSNKDITPRLEQITNSSKNLVENFKEIIWATNPLNDKVESLIIYIRSYVSDFLENTNIEAKFILPEKIPEIIIEADIRRNIFLIIKEWVNNIVKHSETNTLILLLNLTNNKLQIEIRDFGKGLSSEDLNGRGNGLKNILRRSEEINAFCNFRNHTEGGCLLEFSININKIT